MNNKDYQREKAIELLNEIVNTAKDLEGEYSIKDDLHTEIFNFLQNNNIDRFEI